MIANIILFVHNFSIAKEKARVNLTHFIGVIK